MRVALLSTQELAGDGASCPRSFLIVGGETIIARQARQALAMGCTRIICIATGLPPELVAVQHMLERAGARFQSVRDARSLKQLIDPADEILGLSDGVLPDSSIVSAAGPAVFAFPAEQALPAGYERLDRDRCWAGVVRCTGAEIAGLDSLPGDIDPLAALMRSALQAGHPIVPVAVGAMASGDWWRIENAATASKAGQFLLMRKVRPAGWSAPGNALVDRLILRRAEDLVRRPGHRAAIAALAAAGLLATLGATWFGSLPWALMALALASVAIRATMVIHRMTKESTVEGEPVLGNVSTAIIDLVLLTVLAFPGTGHTDSAMIYPVLVLLGALYLATRAQPVWLNDLGRERAAILLILALASVIGVAPLATMGISLALLVLLFIASGRNRLTVA